jgi:hypothetical protein
MGNSAVNSVRHSKLYRSLRLRQQTPIHGIRSRCNAWALEAACICEMERERRLELPARYRGVQKSVNSQEFRTIHFRGFKIIYLIMTLQATVKLVSFDSFVFALPSHTKLVRFRAGCKKLETNERGRSGSAVFLACARLLRRPDL